MPKKYVDIDNAIEMLKADGSTKEMQRVTRRRLDKPKSQMLPRVGAIGIATSVGVILFWPRVTAGNAWGQALRASKNAKIVHYVSRDKNGNIGMEEWTSGNNHAQIMYDRHQRVYMEWRSDGKQLYSFFGLNSQKDLQRNPNCRLFGTVSKWVDYSITSSTGKFEGHLDKLIEFQKAEVIRHVPISTKSGPGIQYELNQKYPFKNSYLVTVDTKSGLIVEMNAKDGMWTATYDYPQMVDPTIFEPRPQLVKSIAVYDLLAQGDLMLKYSESGLGTQNGVTLRLVTLDAYGTLWAVWTGSPVNGKLEHPFTIPGAKLGTAFGLRKFTSGALVGKDNFVTTSDGSRLYGMAREAFSKIGDKIDINIPLKSGGFAKFKSVPVVKVGTIYGVGPWGTKS